MDDIMKDMKETLSKLREGADMPGLDVSSIAENYVETECRESLDECKTSKEREERKKKFVAHYVTGPGKTFIQENIDRIKFLYKQVTDSFDSLQSSVPNIMAANAVPSVITTGAATSVPNPAYSVIDNAQKKHALMAILKSITGFLEQLFSYAILIDFVLPGQVQTLVSVLAAITAALNAIPG